MFEKLSVAPPDPVFGLLEVFKADPRPEKINLTVGVYQDADGRTPVLDCVQRAEQILADRAVSKAYLPIDGLGEFNAALQRLVLGESHPATGDGRVFTAQTPGGTAALRIAAEMVASSGPGKKILVSNPTWANHPQIFSAAGLQVTPWKYLNDSGTAVDLDAALAAIDAASPGDAVLLHTVCHNPTGFDFDRSQWNLVLHHVRERGLVPVFDFAYQGFRESLDADAAIIQEFCLDDQEAFVCSSFSKNFGLYSERVGGVIAVGRQASHMPAVGSQIKAHIRTFYSTPPAHGGRIVQTVFSQPELTVMWHGELAAMRTRIGQMRQRLVQELAGRCGDAPFSFLASQAGMFSFSGLNAVQARQLRDDHAVYIVDSGRINVAGLNENNIVAVADAIAAVTETRDSSAVRQQVC